MQLTIKIYRGDVFLNTGYFCQDYIKIGSLPGSTIQLGECAKMHAVIECEGDSAKLIDLNSAEGTKIGGSRVVGIAPLATGDNTLEIGPFTLVVTVPSARAQLEPSEPAGGLVEGVGTDAEIRACGVDLLTAVVQGADDRGWLGEAQRHAVRRRALDDAAVAQGLVKPHDQRDEVAKLGQDAPDGMLGAEGPVVIPAMTEKPHDYSFHGLNDGAKSGVATFAAPTKPVTVADILVTPAQLEAIDARLDGLYREALDAKSRHTRAAYEFDTAMYHLKREANLAARVGVVIHANTALKLD